MDELDSYRVHILKEYRPVKRGRWISEKEFKIRSPKFKDSIQKRAYEMNRYFSEEQMQMENKYMKKHSTALLIWEMYIITTPRFYLTPEKMAIMKKSTNNQCWRSCGEKRNSSALLVGVWLVQLLWKSVWCCLKKLGWEILFESSIPLLGIFPEELKTSYHSDIHAHMFIAIYHS